MHRNAEDGSLSLKTTRKKCVRHPQQISGAVNWEDEKKLEQRITTDLSELIAENFGANATYVEGLLGRFRSNPESVDESWQAYFTELLGGGGTAAPENGRNDSAPRVAKETSVKDSTKADARAKADGSATATAAIAPAVERVTTTPARSAESHVEAVPLRGAALKIVENMEASLSVPTA